MDVTKPKLEPRRNCFAYGSDHPKNGCKALNELYCAKDPRCRFFKLKDQEDRKIWQGIRKLI